MSEIKNNDDIKLLMDFLEYTCKHQIESDITPFSNVDKIYKWTNEEFGLYPTDNLDGKKVLTITSSGDHGLDAVLKGAKDIDSIDINVFCKYYSALKMAMIKKYDYYDFYDILRGFTNDNMGLWRLDILDKVSQFLTAKEIKFWTEYINFKEKSNRSIFRNLLIGPKFNSYNSEEKYNCLKDKLADVKINYYDGDIISSNDVLKNKSYDCLYLSNVLERIQTECKYEDRIEVILILKKHLNNNASIYNYSFKKNEEFSDLLSEILANEYEFDSYSAFEKGIEKQHSMLIMRKI